MDAGRVANRPVRGAVVIKAKFLKPSSQGNLARWQSRRPKATESGKVSKRGCVKGSVMWALEASSRHQPDPRHTTNPPDSCLSRSFPTAPPGGRLWHGFAVRRPPVGRGGRGLTFGLASGLRLAPMQTVAGLDIGGMQRKATEPSFYTERTLAEFLAVSDRTIPQLDSPRRASQLQARRRQADRSG